MTAWWDRNEMPSVEERLAYLEGRAADTAVALTDFRAEVHDVCTEVRDLRTEMNSGFTSLRNSFDTRFAAADVKLTWVIGTQVGMLLMIASAALGMLFK